MRSSKVSDRPHDWREDASRVQIGRIVNHHGVRGELRVLLHNPASTLLDQCPTVILRGEGEDRQVAVVSARRHKRFVLVRFDGVLNVDAAAPLIGREVWVSRKLLPPTGPDEAYHVDLLDCRVETEDGREIGFVREVMTTASNDVCAVDCGGRELLIPLIADVIVRLDVDGRRIVVRPIPGLLEDLS